jgi:hypothetical protein
VPQIDQGVSDQLHTVMALLLNSKRRDGAGIGGSCRFGKSQICVGNLKSMAEPGAEGSVAALRRRPGRVDAVG